MSYPQRVWANLVPRSEGSTLPEAFEEWSFTDNVQDHEEPIETCQLCEQEQLRYHFEIRNSVNGNILWVGSVCILRFGISIFENGRKLTPNQAKKKLDRLTAKMQRESCVRALERLAQTESNEILANALKYYKEHKYLTPKFANVVFWRLDTHHIDHHPSFFKISLQKDKYKADLKAMDPRSVHRIWRALTTAQRKIAVAIGHSAPPQQPSPPPSVRPAQPAAYGRPPTPRLPGMASMRPAPPAAPPPPVPWGPPPRKATP